MDVGTWLKQLLCNREESSFSPPRIYVSYTLSWHDFVDYVVLKRHIHLWYDLVENRDESGGKLVENFRIIDHNLIRQYHLTFVLVV